MGGALYLVIIALGMSQEVAIRQRIIVTGNGAETATNLRSMASLWRLGIASELVLLLCTLCLAVILYLLLRPVSQTLAMLAVLCNVTSVAIEGAAALYLMEGLITLDSTGFSAAELAAMTATSLAMHSYGFGAALIFFGFECLVVGYLLVRSGMLPRAIGLLMGLAGLCYLTNSFSLIVAPGAAERLVPAILIPAFVGESALALWLLFGGVREQGSGPRPGTRLAASAA